MTCDVCKKESIAKSSYDTGYKNATLGFGEYNSEKYDLCPECQVKYGLVDEKDKEKSVYHDLNTADTLYEIIARIVAETRNE